MAEYNAWQAADAEKNPAAQIKMLDDFVAKYPNSALLNYIYTLYYKNYGAQKNFPKTIEYCNKLIALGDKASVTEKYQAYSVWAFAYFNIPNPDPQTAKAAHDAAPCRGQDRRFGSQARGCRRRQVCRKIRRGP